MKYFILKIIIGFSAAIFTMTACHKQTENLNRLDIETINFDTDITLLLNSDKYILQEQSEVENTAKYYNYSLDSLRYGNITFSANDYNKYSRNKEGELDDVFDANENINRIDIFSSSDGKTITGIGLIISDQEDAKKLLIYLKKEAGEDNIWEKENKTYILKNEIWQIDNTKMTTLSLYILADKDIIERLK